VLFNLLRQCGEQVVRSIGRLIPLSINSPTGSTFTAFSTFINTRGLIKMSGRHSRRNP
jgi:hypothetical protein